MQKRKKGKLILITSHVLSDLEDLTTDVLYLQEGKLVFLKTIVNSVPTMISVSPVVSP